MRSAILFNFVSLIISVLAGRYIVILRPYANLDKFLVKLEQGGTIWVERRYEPPSFFNGAVITTNDYNETSLLKFPEVLVAEEDRIITIDPIIRPSSPPPPRPDVTRPSNLIATIVPPPGKSDVPRPTEPTVTLVE